ncbi:MAG: hypothetical protein EZS28_052203, partial [Streblomastix strix]
MRMMKQAIPTTYSIAKRFSLKSEYDNQKKKDADDKLHEMERRIAFGELKPGETEEQAKAATLEALRKQLEEDEQIEQVEYDSEVEVDDKKDNKDKNRNSDLMDEIQKEVKQEIPRLDGKGEYSEQEEQEDEGKQEDGDEDAALDDILKPPSTWVKPLQLSREYFQERYASGVRVFSFIGVKEENFAPFSMADGLVNRVYIRYEQN